VFELLENHILEVVDETDPYQELILFDKDGTIFSLNFHHQQQRWQQ
jgi:hypothetical protein